MKKVISECKVFLINFFGSVAAVAILVFLFGDAIAGFDHIFLGMVLIFSAFAVGNGLFIFGRVIVYFREKRKNKYRIDYSKR